MAEIAAAMQIKELKINGSTSLAPSSSAVALDQFAAEEVELNPIHAIPLIRLQSEKTEKFHRFLANYKYEI